MEFHNIIIEGKGTVISMKKKNWLYALLVMLSGMLLTACTNEATQDGTKSTQQTEGEEEITEDDIPESTQYPVSEADTETVYAEKERDEQLEQLLIDYYQLPEEYQGITRYYYDDIDLNEDGEKEFIVVVVGEYTECSGGDPALILKKDVDGYQILESFDYVRTPVYVSKATSDGWYDLIFPAYGGEEGTGFRVFHYKEGVGYQNDTMEFIEDMDPEFCGKKILANNFIDDMDKGNYLTLGGYGSVTGN